MQYDDNIETLTSQEVQESHLARNEQVVLDERKPEIRHHHFDKNNKWKGTQIHCVK